MKKFTIMTSEVENLEGEIWVPIFRHYEISNMGRVVSNKWGYRLLMKTCKNNRNYDCIDFRVNGKKYKTTVHRMVALIFVNNLDPNRVTVNHENGKDDNRASSLSWMTYSENSQHGVENGYLHSGSSHYAAILDECQIRTIKSIGNELPRWAVARYFKVKPSYISNVVRGKSWKHITV